MTTPKIGDAAPNEDSVMARGNILAVSDGAGGCGIFAKEWSQYLLDQLPEQPFGAFSDFSTWTDSIWEEFYQARIADMGKYDFFVANKFDNEGSFATLAAVWLEEERMHWCVYGDSAVFVLNRASSEMQFMSTDDVAAYEKNPPLINWKDLPKESAYRHGTCDLGDDDIVLVASDALSCYITMLYYSYHNQGRLDSIESAGKLASLVSSIREQEDRAGSFVDALEESILTPDGGNEEFRKKLSDLHAKGCILDDDFSLVGALSVKG